MDSATFDKFRNLVYEKSGIAIKPDKIALVTARVGKRMRALAIDDSKMYLDRVLNDPTGEELVMLLDSISTNVTDFFRENHHFTFLTEKVREWADSGSGRFRFWSAASSTGEEPYSIAMTVLNALGNVPSDVKILATDISTRVLGVCSKGVYSARQMEPVPPEYRQRFFSKTGVGDSAQYEAGSALKKITQFARLNLSEVPFPMKGPFDVVFCRNVMIYFDTVVRKRLLEECYRLCRKGGYLFVGHAETLTGILSAFKPVAPSIYVKD
jgi:chemotaxis protein methyltransferase CheR